MLKIVRAIKMLSDSTMMIRFIGSGAEPCLCIQVAHYFRSEATGTINRLKFFQMTKNSMCILFFLIERDKSEYNYHR